MLAAIVTLVGYGLWVVLAKYIAKSVQTLFAIIPGAYAAFQEMSRGQIRPHHIVSGRRAMGVLRKGPRAAIRVATPELIRMWLLVPAGISALLIFIGSCFLATGAIEIVFGVVLELVAILTGFFIFKGIAELTDPSSTMKLRARMKLLPAKMLDPRTSVMAGRLIFGALVCLGLMAIAFDFAVVGGIRYFVL